MHRSGSAGTAMRAMNCTLDFILDLGPSNILEEQAAIVRYLAAASARYRGLEPSSGPANAGSR